jgi:hypothetical protein
MPATDLRYVYLPFVDVRKSTAKTDDGIEIPTRIVSGVMTDETLDLDGEIVDYDAAKKAATDWFRDWANVREQHSSNAIGTGIGMVADDVSRQIRTTIEVVDPLAIVKIDKGVLKGQSIGMRGGRKLVDAKAPKGRWVGFTQVEDSIVDRPANPTAKFAVTKSAKDGSMEIGEAMYLDDDEIHKIATATQDKLAAGDSGKGNAPGAMVESPLVGGLVANIEGGLNEHRTAPASAQVKLPPDTAGDELDTQPGSALRRKKKPTPEIGGAQSQNAATQTPKGSIIDGQALPGQGSGEGVAQDVTSPSGATAGACPDGSCSCGDCGPSCTGNCCDECSMEDDLDRRETLHFGANAEYLKFVEADIYKRDFTASDRKRLAGEGKAMPDGSFPIANEEDLHNAIRAIGRASNPAAAKKHIKARASAMGMTDALPDDWKSATPHTTKSTSEEEIEAMYAKAAPQLKTLLEAGDTKAALAVLHATELLTKGSIIAGQAGGTDDADGVEVVVDPASGKKKRTKPEQGGAGQGDHAPESEDVAPTKAATADSMKALMSEVSKAVDTALKPLRDTIAELEKRGVPGPIIRQTAPPSDVRAEMVKAGLAHTTLEQLQDLAENYPDGQIRMGFKQILADVTKGVSAEA